MFVTCFQPEHPLLAARIIVFGISPTWGKNGLSSAAFRINQHFIDYEPGDYPSLYHYTLQTFVSDP
jgi:hypothetical protein